MDLSEIGKRGLVLLGCGRMGGAMLKGWLARGMPPAGIHVIDPAPADWLEETGVSVNGELPRAPAVAILAVKPQMMGEALPALKDMGGGGTVFVSVAAGTTIARLEDALGAGTPVVRAMPNTPAAIGRGITAITGNAAAGEIALEMAEALLAAVGEVERLEDEGLMDAVTALSGSGPAYVFHLIEAMAEGGEALGLEPDQALRLARSTVAGAGALAVEVGDPPGDLREAVTSPGGTTAAALEVLMQDEGGMRALVARAMERARDRGRELGA